MLAIHSLGPKLLNALKELAEQLFPFTISTHELHRHPPY
jgi:hypothetical protein